MQQTTKYQFNLIEGGDDFSPNSLNENMEKVETALSETSNTLSALMETVDGHKIAVGSYTGNGDVQTINVGFTPKAVFVHNRWLGASSSSQSALVLQDGPGYDSKGPTSAVYIVAGGFEVTQTANTNFNYSSYTFNYLAVR